MKYSTIILFCLVFFGQISYANLIECEHTGIFNTGCSVDEGSLLIDEFGLEEKYDFDVSFLIDYKYKCQGHDVGIRFVTDLESSEPIHPEEIDRTDRVDGRSLLNAKAVNPNLFYRASLRDCELTINNIGVSPSFNTLTIWEVESTSQTKIINNLIETYKLAKRFETFINWSRSSIGALDSSFFGESGLITSRLAYSDLTWNDVTNLNGDLLPANEMPSGWGDILLQFPEMIDLVVVGVVIKSIKRDGGIPVDPSTGLPYAREKIERSSSAVKDTYLDNLKSQLLSEKQKGEEIIQRSTTWNSEVDTLLLNVLGKVQEVIR